MNLFLLSLTLATSLSSLCVQPSLANWPVFYIENGETAVVPCVPKGDETAYFWSKGEDYASSMQAASRVLNIPSSTWERYSVAENGSLVIENVNVGDGGIYHCRIVSEHTNCHGAISVKVLHQDFKFGIEECHPKETCTLQVEPDTTTNLTCTATGVPSSFSLKWYNGSEVITSVSSEHSSSKSTTISETITMSSEFGLPLTCKAVDMENRQTCGRFAHVRLNKTDKATQHTDSDKSSARWVIPLVLLIVVSGFTILLLIFTYVRIKKDKKDTNGPSNSAEEDVGLMSGNTYLEPKGDEITELKNKLEQKQMDLMDLQAKFEPKEDEITELKNKLEPKDDKITELKNKLEPKDDEITELKNKLEIKQMDLMDLQAKFEPKEFEITELKNKLEQKQMELTDFQAKYEPKNDELPELKNKLEDDKKPENVDGAITQQGDDKKPENLDGAITQQGDDKKPENLDGAITQQGDDKKPENLDGAISQQGDDKKPENLDGAISQQGDVKKPENLDGAITQQGDDKKPENLDVAITQQGDDKKPENLDGAITQQGDDKQPDNLDEAITQQGGDGDNETK